jgi:hypothetical protein
MPAARLGRRLADGQATGADEGSTATYNVRVIDGRIALELPAEALAKAS